MYSISRKTDNDNGLETLTQSLTGKICPNCESRSLKLVKGDYPIVVCRDCDAVYPITRESLDAVAFLEDLDARMEDMTCTSCQHEHMVLSFRCSAETGSAFYYIGCPNCGNTLEEYR